MNTKITVVTCTDSFDKIYDRQQVFVNMTRQQ